MLSIQSGWAWDILQIWMGKPLDVQFCWEAPKKKKNMCSIFICKDIKIYSLLCFSSLTVHYFVWVYHTELE